jgi:hypothetical protein
MGEQLTRTFRLASLSFAVALAVLGGSTAATAGPRGGVKASQKHAVKQARSGRMHGEGVGKHRVNRKRERSKSVEKRHKQRGLRQDRRWESWRYPDPPRLWKRRSPRK